MPTITYLHGFLSSPLSTKAQATQAWLAREHPECRFQCPQLSAYPAQAAATLERLMAEASEPMCLIGSSLGGFWASYIVERTAARAVLINPAVAPHKLVDSLVGQRLKNYYTDDFYTLTPACAEFFGRLKHRKPDRRAAYWLLVQTGDETIDYRESVEVYTGSRQTVLDGGNHAFEGFEAYLPAIYRFLVKGAT